MDLRRLPLPEFETPLRHRRLQRIYRMSFETGYRGWPLNQYFSGSERWASRRDALDAGFHAGQAVLAKLLRGRLLSMGIKCHSLCWPIPGADWPNSTAPVSMEMDLRRARVPSPTVPEECGGPIFCTNLGTIYEMGFEAGYRGWPRVNRYRRFDFRGAWESGYEAGEDALQKRLAAVTHSEEYASGFQRGFRNQRTSASRPRPGSWQTGFRDGRKLARAAR